MWFSYDYEPNVNYDFTLLPIPTDYENIQEDHHLVIPQTEEQEKYFPFDEYKLSRITKAKLLDRFDECHVAGNQLKIKGNLRQFGMPYMVVTPNGCILAKEDDYKPITSGEPTVKDWYLVGLWDCDLLADIDLTDVKQLYFILPYQSQAPLSCVLAYGTHTAILTVAYAKNKENTTFKNLNTTITADENGKLGKETIMSMMDKLGKLQVFGAETENAKAPTQEEIDKKVEKDTEEFIDALKASGEKSAINLASTVLNIAPDGIVDAIKDVAEVAESIADKVAPVVAEVADKVIPMVEPVLPETVKEIIENVTDKAKEIVENVKDVTEIPSKNVTETPEIPSKNVTEVTETHSKNEEISSNTDEAITIDSLRYEFSDLKTKVTMFDKHLREFAKAGAYSKKIQTDLEKYKAENIKLREEVKTLYKRAEQLEKIQKYISDLSK